MHYFLLSLGDINVASSDGWTPLLLAIYKNHKCIVSYLLTHPDIDVNKVTKKGTPLHLACYCNKESLVRSLFEIKADPKYIDVL